MHRLNFVSRESLNDEDNDDDDIEYIEKLKLIFSLLHYIHPLNFHTNYICKREELTSENK